MESRLYKSKNNIHVRGQGSNPRSTEEEKYFWTNFFVSFFSHLVIYCANVWNEREANNTRERKGFWGWWSEKSHKAFFCSALQMAFHPKTTYTEGGVPLRKISSTLPQPHPSVIFVFFSLDDVWLPTTQKEEKEAICTTLKELFGELKGIQFTIRSMYALYITCIYNLLYISTKVYIHCNALR